MNESSRLTLMDALNEACAIKFKEVAFAECNRSLPTLQREGQYQPWHRFTLPLQGNWGQVIVRNGHYEELKIGVGGAIVFHPYCRHYQLEERQDGRCLAVVLRSNYLRLVYVENLLSKFEYHICDSLSSCVINAMATLGSLDNQKEKAAAALDLLPVVLDCVVNRLVLYY